MPKTVKRVTMSAAMAVAVVFVSCTRDHPVAPPAELDTAPVQLISDADHNDGNKHFYFLPPVVKAPTTNGTFDATKSPTVQICEFAGGACVAIVTSFSLTQGPDGELLRVQSDHYAANWHTDQFGLDATKTYRIRVLVGAIQLGFADVDVVSNGSELKNVQTNEFIALLNGRTLPIKFRIEVGAVAQIPSGGSAPVGPTGGNVTTTDGVAGLVIPATALTNTTNISIGVVASPPAGVGPWAAVIELGPTGTTFAQPATLIASYDPSQLPTGVPESALGLFTFDGTGWVEVSGSVVDEMQNTVSADINHFSFYAVMIRAIRLEGAANSSILTVGQTVRAHVTALYYPDYNSPSIPLENRAVYWYTTSPLASIEVGPTYTDHRGDSFSPLATAHAPGVVSIYAEVNGSRSGDLEFTIFPSLSLFVSGDPFSGPRSDTFREVGIDQVFVLSIRLPQAPNFDLPITLSHTNTAVANSALTAVMTAGTADRGVSVIGLSPGTDTIIVSAFPFGHDTVVVQVGIGNIMVVGWPASLAAGDSALIRIRPVNPPNTIVDNGGNNTAFALAGANLRFSNGTNTITSIGVPNGTSSTPGFYVVATSFGTGTATITNPNYVPASLDVPIAVAGTLDLLPSAMTTVAGWNTGLILTRSAATPSPLSVSIRNLNGFAVVFEPGAANQTHGGNTGTYVINANATDKVLGVFSLNGVGVDTIIASAPGFAPDTGVITLVQGVFHVTGWPGTLAVGDSAALQVTLHNLSGALGSAAFPFTASLEATAGLAFSQNGTTITTLALRQSGSMTFYVKASAPGLQQWAIRHRDYVTYENSVTTTAPEPPPFVAAGGKSSCATRADGTVLCWGEASFGATAASSGAFAAIGAGFFHYCGIRPDETLNCWGYGSDNRTLAPAGTFKQISVGAEHNCALRTNDTPACWGFLNDGRGSPPAGTYKQIAVGWYHGCAIRPDDSLVCWGRNDVGQATPPAGAFLAVTAGQVQTCAIRMDQQLVCFGDAGTVPTGTFQSISASSGFHACGVRTTGALACWGSNAQGQANAPVGQFIQVSAGWLHSCAVRQDHAILCWGSPATGATSVPAEFATP